MPVEAWKSFFDWATVILIGLTVISGAGALVTGNTISKRQEQQLADAGRRAAEANARAEKEATARAAMLLQLKWRDFSKEQMDAFVDLVKGHLAELNVFTLPDPEAS